VGKSGVVRVDAMIPDWYYRPSGPGIWVCVNWEGPLYTRDFVMRLTQEEIDRGVPFHTQMVFGPIPEPPEEMKPC
jgi:hypothetical protein